MGLEAGFVEIQQTFDAIGKWEWATGIDGEEWIGVADGVDNQIRRVIGIGLRDQGGIDLRGEGVGIDVRGVMDGEVEPRRAHQIERGQIVTCADDAPDGDAGEGVLGGEFL